MQSVSSSIGSPGKGIGYAGVTESIGVEIDTWCNDANNDPDSNHVGIVLEGSLDHDAIGDFTAGVEPDFDNGAIWHVWVDYDGAVLEVRVSDVDVQPQQPILAREIDVPQILGQLSAYVGFTSATGSAWGRHELLSWEYDIFEPICAGDLDGNGIVDGADLGLLLNEWGANLQFYDLNGDDVVNGEDVGIMAAAWGPCP